jgi:hypothetical protein
MRVGEALKAGALAETYATAHEVSEVKDVISVGDRAWAIVREFDEAWTVVHEAWPFWSGILMQLANGLEGILVGAPLTDPSQAQRLIDLADKLFAAAIAGLGGKAAAHITVEGREKAEAAKEAVAHKDEAQRELAEQTASPGLKTEVALVQHAVERLALAKTPAEREAASQELRAQAEAMSRAFAASGSFSGSALAAGQLAKDKKHESEEWEQKIGAAKKELGEEPGLKEQLKKTSGSVGEKLKDAFIQLCVGALTGAEHELAVELEQAVAPGGHGGVDVGRIAVAALSKGAAAAVSHGALETIKGELKRFIKAGIEKLIEEHWKGLGGLAEAADKPIDSFLATLEKQLGIEERIEKPFENLFGHALGVAEEPKELGAPEKR